MLNDSEIQRVLVIAAHPDDIDFSAAGTVARWTDAGIGVIYCLVTDGDAGGFDESLPRAEMAALRRKPSRRPRPRSWACTTCGSSATRTGGWSPPWGCARTWPG